MYGYGDIVNIIPSQRIFTYGIMDIHDKYMVINSQAEFEQWTGRIVIDVYHIKNTRTGKMEKVSGEMLEYDKGYLRKLKIEKCLKKGI